MSIYGIKFIKGDDLNEKVVSIDCIVIISSNKLYRSRQRIVREVDREYKERGRECTYNHKGELIGSCDFIN